MDRTYAAGELRVSDADRDRALAELSEHFQAGRLTTAELEDRTGRALGARTGNDLAVLLADLPPAQGTGASVPVSAPARRAGWRVGPVALICLSVCVAAAVSVAASGRHVHVVLVPWWLIPIAIYVWRRRRWQR